MSDTSTCALCGHDLGEDERTSGVAYCASCAVEAAERHLTGSEEATTAEGEQSTPPRRVRNTRLLLGALVVLFLAATAFAIPQLIGVASLTRPLREGFTDTDATTDACIENLWRAAANHQSGGTADSDLVCPESGSAYVISGPRDDTVIACPKPEAHGLATLDINVGHGGPRAER